MICFRDMSFCAESGATCGNTTCPRYFTQADRDAARIWWGGDGAPISYMAMPADCPDFKPLVHGAR